MLKTIKLRDRIIEYNFQHKNVKNINVRIKRDKSVYVSANKNVPYEIVEKFLEAKADFIIKSLCKFESVTHKPSNMYFTETQIRDVVNSLCEKAYPYFEKRGVRYPEIKFRKMTSQWGNCRKEKGILTFNTYLMFAPLECVEYVVLHEFTHFLHPDHSKNFYEELSKVCPDWKIYRKKLNEIHYSI